MKCSPSMTLECSRLSFRLALFAVLLILGCSPRTARQTDVAAFYVDGYDFIGKDMDAVVSDLGPGVTIERDSAPFNNGWTFWILPDGKGVLTVYFYIDGGRRVVEAFQVETIDALGLTRGAPECRRVKRSEICGVAIDAGRLQIQNRLTRVLGRPQPLGSTDWTVRQGPWLVFARLDGDETSISYRVEWWKD